MASFFLRAFARNDDGETFAWNDVREAASLAELMDGIEESGIVPDIEDDSDQGEQVKAFIGEKGEKLVEVELKLKRTG